MISAPGVTDLWTLAVIGGMAAYFWRRDVMATIVVGMAVYLPLHIGFGW